MPPSFGRHLCVVEDTRNPPRRRRGAFAEQQPVLKRPPLRQTRFRASSLAERTQTLTDQPRQWSNESARRSARLIAALAIVDDGGDQRPEIELHRVAARDVDSDTPLRIGRARQRFQLDRRLPFEVTCGAQPDQRRHGIEQPAGGGGQDSVDAALDHRVTTAALVLRRRASGASPSRHRAEAQRHAPRLAHRGVAAGQRHVAQVRAALERRQVRAEELRAPDRAVGAVAGAVECATPMTSPSQAVLRHAAGDVRVMMLHADLRLDAVHAPARIACSR